eukprot:1194168-Amphidinium_carterae.1
MTRSVRKDSHDGCFASVYKATKPGKSSQRQTKETPQQTNRQSISRSGSPGMENPQGLGDHIAKRANFSRAPNPWILGGVVIGLQTPGRPFLLHEFLVS